MTNWEILHREDCPDGRCHMGLLLLYPKHKTLLFVENTIEFCKHDVIFSSKKNQSQQILAQLLQVRIRQRLLSYIYIRETPNEREVRKINEKIDVSSYTMGDINLSVDRNPDKSILDILCGNERILHLNDITTIGMNVRQLDHIMVRKTIKYTVQTDSYYNYISDHRTICLRISQYANDEQNTTDDSLKSIKKEKKDNKIVIDDEQDDDTELLYPKTSDMYLSSLEGTEWLNDNVINDYLELLGKKYRDVFIFPHFFAEMFFSRQRGYNNVSKYCHTVDIFQKRLVIFPILRHSHWVTAVLNFEEKRLVILDPYIDQERTTIEILDHLQLLEKLENEFLVLYFYDKGYSDWISLEKLVKIPPEIPKQDDGWNCGVFVLEFVRCLCSRQQFNFTSNDMANFRARIKSELQNERLQIQVRQNEPT